MSRESLDAAKVRWELLGVLQDHYREFIPFLHDVMELLGFTTSEIQEDIALWLENGPESLMVQAQRGQAKTTIAAAFAVWCLIGNPKLRVLIISAGGTQANEISTLIVRIMMSMDVLECLRPDKNHGDRTSVEAFDVHHSLKGIDKSPSVACCGITANLQGKRADLLIADDIESAKNSSTALMRAQLMHLTLDFTSICQHGRIIWLGTPQTSDSIYNSLPGRGVSIRIWPGRYPTPELVKHYGEYLAPLLRSRMEADPSLQGGGGLLGKDGKPTDPTFMGEAVLQRKQLDQGAAYFQLQHMLNTALTDAGRHPLKTEQVVVMRLDRSRRVPITVTPGYGAGNIRVCSHGTFKFNVNTPSSLSTETVVLPMLVMCVDPAGGGANGDETGYAIGGMVNGNVFVLDVGAVPGGYSESTMNQLASVAASWGVEVIVIEKNMGYGAFAAVFQPVVRKRLPTVAIDEDLVHGQKETRIIATIEPVLGRSALILNEAILASDWETAQAHGQKSALTYSLMYQMSKLTKDRNSLIHDDRLDALEALVRRFQSQLAQDQERALEAAKLSAWKKMVEDPLGRNRYGAPGAKRFTVLTRRLGKR